MTDKINVTYLYKGFTKHHPEFLPEHQGSGFTGDFTDEDIELKPIAYFFDDSIAEKTRIALNHELADQDIEDDEEEFLAEVFGHDEFFGNDHEDAQKYIVEVRRNVIETFEVLAENEEDAEENYADGNEISWEQIESEVLTTVERKEDYWRKA